MISKQRHSAKLLMAVLGGSAVLTMGGLTVLANSEQKAGPVVVAEPFEYTEPQATFGESGEVSTAPSRPETTFASPPVTAEPAPTEEPG